jgi:CrcB protein
VKLILIVLFGTVGCLARWAVEEVIERRVLSHRPYATMAVNVLGALIAGFVVFASASVTSLVPTHHSTAFATLYGSRWMATWSPELLTGFCGGFTTFSSAIAIPYLDWRHGQRARAAVLILATPALCILGYWLGELLTHLAY